MASHLPLRANPVLAAKHQPMTSAADAAAQAAEAQAGPGSRQVSGGPRAARQGPGRVRRLLAALDLLHGRPPHQLGSRDRLRCRQPPGGGSLTSASCPHPAPVSQIFLPDEGESEPVPAQGTSPVRHPGQLSPVARSF